jgi:hypothetical protein
MEPHALPGAASVLSPYVLTQTVAKNTHTRDKGTSGPGVCRATGTTCRATPVSVIGHLGILLYIAVYLQYNRIIEDFDGYR